MLRLIDRGLTVICVAAAALVVVLLFAGPSLIGAKKSTAAAPSSSAPSSSGSGSSGSSTSGAASTAGKAVFTSAGCATCHTLKDAGATGSVGPNLDQLQPSAGAVSGIVRSGGGGMPSFSGKLSDAQIAAVATYVSSVAGH
jgi:mono/diheme cytochrome c family protein